MKELFLIKQFLSFNKALYDYQSGFGTKHPTDTYFSFFNHKILKGFENALRSCMILIDFQKAFNTINHDILLRKLSIIVFFIILLSGFNLIHLPVILR